MQQSVVPRLLLIALAATGLLASTLTAPTPAHAAGGLSIEVLSSRSDTVSGGNALVLVRSDDGGDLESLHVEVAGVDATADFAAGLEPGTQVAYLEDLRLGRSTITASADSHADASLEIVNHPLHGPLFSGPQNPMYCSASGAPWNLGDVDEFCHVATPTVSYVYRTTGGAFAPLPEGALPGDVASTTTTEGHTVPYVVRIERGTINRAVYETAVLHEPGTPLPDAWTDTPGWNGKLLYTFGGACDLGYGQGTSTGGVQQDLLLRQGYGVASATLNVYAINCDDVTSAETASMVKERFIESYGPATFTMGWGGSAGTMQQLLIANNYPGIIDGVIGEIGYPDERTTTVGGHDCAVLGAYWATTPSGAWTTAQKLAVTGKATELTCFLFTLFDGVDRVQECPSAVPVGDRWTPSNTDGIRCTIADFGANYYGVDEDGYGLPIVPDNVGLQYGLNALLDGVITAEQFLDLNASVGGMDWDGNYTAERSSASVEAIERAFAGGRVNMFSGGLTTIPVIEYRGYTDPTGDFHERYKSWIIRERMHAAQGDLDTYVGWTGPSSATAFLQAEALSSMDEWLTNLEELSGDSGGSRDLTVAARPAGLTEGCYDASLDFIAEEIDYFDPTTDCNVLYPYHSDPRIEAGAPVTGEVLKCHLRDPQRSDYGSLLTDDEWATLQTVFADGVCDFSQPSVGATALAGTWLDYDREAPTVSLTVDPAAPDGADGWYRSAPTVTATAADDAGTSIIEVDAGAGLVRYDGPVTIAAEGIIEVAAIAEDLSGNAAETSVDVKIDRTAPTVASSVNGRTVTLTASDSLSGVATIEYRVGGDWEPYSTPVDPPTASNRLEYRATDIAGNVSAIGTAAVAPLVAQLTAGTENDIEVPETAGAGSTITIVVGTSYAGQDVEVWMFSTPVLLAQTTVAANGTVTVTIPASTSAGAHRIAVYDSVGAIIGWSWITITVTAMAMTGATIATWLIPMALGAMALGAVALGGVFVHRRRTGRRKELLAIEA